MATAIPGMPLLVEPPTDCVEVCGILGVIITVKSMTRDAVSRVSVLVYFP
jgi:hypothetical protein